MNARAHPSPTPPASLRRCTNRGPAFTRSADEPSDGKQALLDRSVVLFVRTEGAKTHDDAEFETNMANPQVVKKVRAFRILTCLTGLLKLLIFRQPFMRPDMSMAQKMWDYWDERLDRKFGLPRPSPRKNVKRMSNLTTMCCLNAVAHVFMYKQTVIEHEAGRVDLHPKGRPFEMKFLAQCIPLLQPSPEMIHMAWTMGLEYNIGTSAMGLCGMTIVAEAMGKRVGDWFTRLPADFREDLPGGDDADPNSSSGDKPRSQLHSYVMRDCELTDHASTQAGTATSLTFTKPEPHQKRLPELEKLFDGEPVFVDECVRLRTKLRMKREIREEWKWECSRGERQNAVMRDPLAMLLSTIRHSSTTTVIDTMDLDDEEAGASDSVCVSSTKPSDMLSGVARGKALHREGVTELPAGVDADVQFGFHSERAIQFPGSSNCPFPQAHPIGWGWRPCPYCRTGEESRDAAAVDAAAVSARLSSEASILWPDALEACMFYKPQSLVQFSVGCCAFIESGQGSSAMLGTRATGGLFAPKKRDHGPSGAQRVDCAWWADPDASEWSKTWRKMAAYIRNAKSHTATMFDVHLDGLGELLWLLSTQDNARRCADEPRLAPSERPENCMVTNADKRIGENDYVVKMAPFLDPSPRQMGYVGAGGCREPPQHDPRDEISGVVDTEWQRRLDTLLHAGRFPAMNPLISNRVVVASPIRMNPDTGVELNYGSLHAHTLLLAESVLACATMPGLRNAQEPFCNGQSGPEGLSADRPTHEPGKKRPAQDADVVHTLPYSYDIISIAIAEDAALMLYDDKGETQLVSMRAIAAKYEAAYVAKAYADAEKRNLGAGETAKLVDDIRKIKDETFVFDRLPHLSLRYLGYSEYNRQTLSIKQSATRRKGQPYVEAGDPSVGESRISEAHVRRSLGRAVLGQTDMAAYIGRKQGARSMGAVSGDLFAMSTWYEHCMTSLQARGLSNNTKDEAAVRFYTDMQRCMYPRLYEGWKVLGLTKAVPSTYDVTENEVDDGTRSQKRGRRGDVKPARCIDAVAGAGEGGVCNPPPSWLAAPAAPR